MGLSQMEKNELMNQWDEENGVLAPLPFLIEREYQARTADAEDTYLRGVRMEAELEEPDDEEDTEDENDWDDFDEDELDDAEDSMDEDSDVADLDEDDEPEPEDFDDDEPTESIDVG